MFKYLWMVVVVAPYLWWTFKAIKGLINEIIYTQKCHKRFEFDYLPDVTICYVIVHALAISAWSLVEFILFYSK